MAKTKRSAKRTSLPQRRRRKPDDQRDRRGTESALESERRARREAEAARRRAASLTEMLDRALSESELLNTIATSAAGEHDLTGMLSTALDRLRGVINFTGGSIALVEGDVLVIRAAVGPFAEAALGQRLQRGRGRSWQIVDRGEPFLSGNIVGEGMRPTTPITSYLAVPLVWQGESFGLLEIDSTESDAFEADDLVLLQRVAVMLSGPIELARLYAAEVRALAEAKAGGRRLTLLAEASSVLATSLDYEATLASIAHLAVPTFADWCIVDLLDDQGTIRQVGVAHSDPSKEPLVRELRHRFPPTPNPQHVILRVLSSGRAELTSEVTEADLRARARDKMHFGLLKSLGIHSHMVVPLIARGRTLGAISFIGGPSRRYSPVDLALAEELAARAAVAIDNAHLLAAERQARDETEAALRRVNATNRLIAMAASALDVSHVFDEFSEVLRTLVPFVRVTVSLYDPESETLTMPYFKGPRLTAPPERLEGPKAGTARGWVIDLGQSFIRDDTVQSQQFAEDALLAEAGIRSYVVVPMTVGGRVIGTLNFGHDVPGFYTSEHAQLSQPIADQLGLTVSRLELFEQTRRKAGELSVTLQRALLPAELPRVPFLAITALYQAADPEARVGGDWYDALLLPDDRLLISIGDVAGHGIAAAAAMAQVRYLVRALAIEGRRPADVMAAVNHYLLQLPEPTNLSMWLATLDPTTGELIYGGAGHPPALVQGTDGIRELTSQSPPIGFSSSVTYHDDHAQLASGERLIAYTDGLIEVTRDPIEGERRLRDAVAATLDQHSDHAVRTLVTDVLRGDRQEDDIALLMVDVLPSSAPLSFALPAAPENLRRVRHAVRIYAERVGFPPRRVEEIVAAVGEAALNIVEHAYRGEAGEVAVDARVRDSTLTVSIRDTGEWRPVQERGRGRGRRLMEGFADSVETVAGPAGTKVELRWTLRESTNAENPVAR